MSIENGLPSQVDEAAEMAEELFKKMYPQAEETEEESETQTDELEDDEPDTSDEEDDEDEDDEPETDPAELKKWRDRYLTLKGKYDAEVPRLASQVKDLMTKVTTPPVKDEPEEPEEDFDHIYGEDFAKQIRKVIDDAVQAKLAPVSQKVDSVEDTQKQAATDSFMSYLDESAEGWRDMWEGKDKGFQKFIQTKDPMGLNTYAEYLERFNNDWDADGMAKIFNLYKDAKASKPDTSKERDAMIAPSRAKSNAPPASESKRIITTDFIQQFEIDDRKGKYSDEESMQIWGEILKATQENRVR